MTSLDRLKISTKPSARRKPDACEINILAGGLSQRMGTDKSRLRLGPRTLLGEIRANARRTGLRVKVLRKDCVPRCGPLGGIYTGLKKTRSTAILFLACDMPFVSANLIAFLLAEFAESQTAVFVRGTEGAGFPLVLPRTVLPMVARQIERQEFSLQRLAKALKAKMLPWPRKWSGQLRNINTAADWEKAVRDWKREQVTR